MIIGIDPGANGGIATLGADGEVHQALKMPATPHDIAEAIERNRSGGGVFCYIENVGPMPKQGVSSTFKFGRGFGVLIGVLAALRVPHELVRPQVWQRTLAIPKRKRTESKTAFKNRLKQKAQQLFPQVKITHSVADALLIAEHGRRVRTKQHTHADGGDT